MQISEMPISNVMWVDVNKLSANDYNPNVVYNKELQLLKFSILKQGWIQPILISDKNVIIDGFHRATLAKADRQVNALTGGKVPVVKMTLSEPERMLLTIRINRAKGSHIAIRMSDVIKKLVNDYGIQIQKICEEIGANKDEIELLLMEDVFKKEKITKDSPFSKAWIPNK